jgi:hypothetical protein
MHPLGHSSWTRFWIALPDIVKHRIARRLLPAHTTVFVATHKKARNQMNIRVLTRTRWTTTTLHIIACKATNNTAVT